MTDWDRSLANYPGLPLVNAHCDQRVLHSPPRRVTVATLWTPGNSRWTLSFHPIDEAPETLAAVFTSPGKSVPKGTWPLVIPLTLPASLALASRLKMNRDVVSGSGGVSNAELAITLDGVPPVSATGDWTIFRPLKDELSWPKLNGTELPLAEYTFARSALIHARL